MRIYEDYLHGLKVASLPNANYLLPKADYKTL